MKKKAVHKKPLHRVTHKSTVSSGKKVRTEDRYVILVRSWVFLVLFALMLGVGVVLGNYLNTQLNGSAPIVAGVTTER